MENLNGSFNTRFPDTNRVVLCDDLFVVWPTRYDYVESEACCLLDEWNVIFEDTDDAFMTIHANKFSILVFSPDDLIVPNLVPVCPMTSVFVDVFQRKVGPGSTENDQGSPLSKRVNKDLRSELDRHRAFEATSTIREFDAPICRLTDTKMGIERTVEESLWTRERPSEPFRSESSEMLVI